MIGWSDFRNVNLRFVNFSAGRGFGRLTEESDGYTESSECYDSDEIRLKKDRV